MKKAMPENTVSKNRQTNEAERVNRVSLSASSKQPCNRSRKTGDKLEHFLCPVDEAARIVGQKWTLQIVHHLLDGRSRRFCELQDALGKVNPSTLSSRLKMLEEAGLVSRSQISDIPPHVEYRLTEMGAELRAVINEITRWSNAHLCSSESGKQHTDAADASQQDAVQQRAPHTTNGALETKSQVHLPQTS